MPFASFGIPDNILLKNRVDRLLSDVSSHKKNWSSLFVSHTLIAPIQGTLEAHNILINKQPFFGRNFLWLLSQYSMITIFN